MFSFFFSFRRSIHWKNYIWEPMVSEQTGISVSQAKLTQPIATPQIDRYVKNKQGFSDFWAISYHFVHIAMLIIIQMHFVLLSTISLLFVWEGHSWIILKKGRGSSPQSPPSARAWEVCRSVTVNAGRWNSEELSVEFCWRRFREGLIMSVFRAHFSENIK